MNKVLIIEDDEQISTLLQEYLQKYGYSVEIVNDFENILQAFLQVQPDLVLLDVNLPRYDGFYWCRQIRTKSTVLFYLFQQEPINGSSPCSTKRCG